MKQKVRSASRIFKQSLWSWTNCKPKSWLQTRTHTRALIFFLCHWEFTDKLVQGKPNIDEYFRIWRISGGEKWHEVLIIAEGSRPRQLLFSKYMQPFSINFPNIYNDDLLCSVNVVDWFLLLFWNEGDFSRPTPTRFAPPLLIFFWILFLNQIWQNNVLGWVKGCSERGFQKKIGVRMKN